MFLLYHSYKCKMSKNIDGKEKRNYIVLRDMPPLLTFSEFTEISSQRSYFHLCKLESTVVSCEIIPEEVCSLSRAVVISVEIRMITLCPAATIQKSFEIVFVTIAVISRSLIATIEPPSSRMSLRLECIFEQLVIASLFVIYRGNYCSLLIAARNDS